MVTVDSPACPDVIMPPVRGRVRVAAGTLSPTDVPRCRTPGLGTPVRRPARSADRALGRCDEDAERVACGVGVDVQGLVRVVGAVEQQPRAQAEHLLVGGVEVADRRDGEVEVELLGTGPSGQVAAGSSATGCNASTVRPPSCSTSQSSPCGSGSPAAGGSSPGR
jgi:hypothetical protein